MARKKSQPRLIVIFPTDLQPADYRNDVLVFVPEYLDGELNILKPIYLLACWLSKYDKTKAKKKIMVKLGVDWPAVVKNIRDRLGLELCFYQQVDRELDAKIAKHFATTSNVKIAKHFTTHTILQTNRFILTDADLAEYDGPLRQTSFYAFVRRRLDVLMTDGKYEGNSLTYDVKNRSPPYKGMENDLPIELDYMKNKYVKQAKEMFYRYLESHGSYVLHDTKSVASRPTSKSADKQVDKQVGKQVDRSIRDKSTRQIYDPSTDSMYVVADGLKLKFPIDRAGSLRVLKAFIRDKLDKFGPYQDAMYYVDHSTLFHSGISPMMNLGLITPSEVVECVLLHYKSANFDSKLKSASAKDKTASAKSKLAGAKDKSVELLYSVEGFIRQIIGWREYARYMYSTNQVSRQASVFNPTRKLSADWYRPDKWTGSDPLSLCVVKAFRYGYLHHIERLMVVGNYMTITEIRPVDVYKWFMCFALDAYDWVMDYNIFSMVVYQGQTTKPYICSSAWIKKMSILATRSVATRSVATRSDIDVLGDKSNRARGKQKGMADNQTGVKDQQVGVKDRKNIDQKIVRKSRDRPVDQVTEWLDSVDQLFWKFISKHRRSIAKINRLSGLLRYLPDKATKL